MRETLKTPPASTSPQAVRLREQAKRFWSQPPNDDPYDRPGQRANKALLNAARAYAKVADEADCGRKKFMNTKE